MASNELNKSEMINRVREAVIRRGGTVTIGDIMSETGLGNFEAKEALTSLIATHRGVMRVSESGELEYAFSKGCIRRDYRSWWERNKDAVKRVLKLIFKIIIAAILVIYFIIYLVILIALLSSNRNSNSRSDSGDGLFHFALYFFWGYGDGLDENNKKDPLYTRVFNFVFGPEEEKLDPLEAKTKCAQLIRAKNGVIVVEDWMMISGQTLEQCENDLAQFTAEFNGDAEISENGTLLYVFEDLMKSSKTSGALARNLNLPPSPAWNQVILPRPLLGNPNGGNVAVVALNLFNLVMAAAMIYLFSDATPESTTSVQQLAATTDADSILLGLGIIPLIFSALIFAGPLIRLPGNIRENKRRKEQNMRNAILKTIFENTQQSRNVTLNDARLAIRQSPACAQFSSPSLRDVGTALADIGDEFNADSANTVQPSYNFRKLTDDLREAEKTRENKRLDKQELGRTVFSTDNNEQEAIEDEENARELAAFSRALKQPPQNRASGGYDSDYRAARDRQDAARSAQSNP